MCVFICLCVYMCFNVQSALYEKQKCSILNWGIAPHWTKTIFQDPSSQGQATPWRGRPSSPGSDLASFAVDGHCTKITTLLHHITSHYTHVAFTLHSITSHYYLYYLIYTVFYSQYIQYIHIHQTSNIPSLEQTGSISPFWGSTNKSSVDVSFRSKMHCNWEHFATAAETSDKSQADAPWTMTWHRDTLLAGIGLEYDVSIEGFAWFFFFLDVQLLYFCVDFLMIDWCEVWRAVLESLLCQGAQNLHELEDAPDITTQLRSSTSPTP